MDRKISQAVRQREKEIALEVQKLLPTANFDLNTNKAIFRTVSQVLRIISGK